MSNATGDENLRAWLNVRVSKIADCGSDHIVARPIDNRLRRYFVKLGHAVQAVAFMPFVNHPIDWWNIQLLTGLEQIYIRDFSRVTPHQRAGVELETGRNVINRVAFFHRIGGHFKARAGRQGGVQRYLTQDTADIGHSIRRLEHGWADHWRLSGGGSSNCGSLRAFDRPFEVEIAHNPYDH